MKKIVALLLVSFLFFSCKWFNADLIAYLEYYSNEAAIDRYELDGSYPSLNGAVHIPSGSPRKIQFIMRNPQQFQLNSSVIWNNAPLGDTVPVSGTDYTLEQVQYNILELTLTNTFLDKLDANPHYGDVSATVGIVAKDTQRVFENFSYTDVIVNSPPTKPQGAVFLKHSDLHTWILAFNLSTTELRKAQDNDIRTVTINEETHDVNINHTDGSFTVAGNLTTDESAVKQGKNITLEDAIGQRYFHGENTVYYVTDIPTAQSPSASLNFTDSRGLTSETTTVTTSGLVKTQYYVAESGNDSNTASISSPYKTLQKAIDTIIASNDSNNSYTIFAKGNVGSGTIAPTSSAVHNIRIEGYDGGASISKLTVNGIGTRLTLASGVNLTELAYTSTNVGVNFASKPANNIRITVPANTANNTLLATGNGANLAESDFTLNSASGSLYVDKGNLHYSTYNQLTLSTAIVSEATITAPKKAGMPEVTIQTDFTTMPNPANVGFDITETTDAMKIIALKNATLEGFTGKMPTDRLENIVLSDIEVSFAASFVSINLRAKDGYAFNRATNETEKHVYITIKGDFNASEKIEWSDIGINKPIGSGIEASGTWDINNSNGNFVGNDTVSTITLDGDVSYAQIADAIKNAIQVQNASVSVSSSNSGVASVGSTTMTATLQVNSGYVFPDGSIEKTIQIEFTVIQIISGTFTTKAVSAKDGTAALGAIQITNFANASSSVEFHYLDVTHEEKRQAIIKSVQDSFNVAFSNATTSATSVAINNNSTQATVQVSISAKENYVFDTSGTTKKELTLSLNGILLPIKTTYFVSATNASDNYAGTQDKPFASVQKAVDVIMETNKTSPGTITYTINISGEVEATASKASGITIDGENSALNITLQGLGPDANAGTLDAANSSSTSRRVLYIDGEHTIVNLKDNLTLTGGEGGNGSGGGVYVANGTFNMYGGTISGNSASDGGGVFVSGGYSYLYGSAVFNMYGGSIENNSTTGDGGGVYVMFGSVGDGVGGIFTMSGGTIQNNTASGRDDNGGGGVCVDGGDFGNALGATFNMSGTAKIANNTAGSKDDSIAGYGGGVYLKDREAYFTMSDGTIEGNTAYAEKDTFDLNATSGGGGVYVTNGVFTMKGGTIKSNSVYTLDAGSFSRDVASGGGVYLNSGDFTMSGGTIESNSAIVTPPSMGSGSSSSTSVGGGVYLASNDATLTMSGGTIKNNTANEHAGVCLYDRASLYLSKTASVIDNTIADTNTESNISRESNGFNGVDFYNVYISGRLTGGEKSIGITPDSGSINLMAKSSSDPKYTITDEDVKKLRIDNKPDANARLSGTYAVAP